MGSQLRRFNPLCTLPCSRPKGTVGEEKEAHDLLLARENVNFMEVWTTAVLMMIMLMRKAVQLL